MTESAARRRSLAKLNLVETDSIVLSDVQCEEQTITNIKQEDISDENEPTSGTGQGDDHFTGCTCCRFCNKSFRHLSRLRQHELTHSAEKLFACSQCSKKFSRKDTLARHAAIHDDEELVSCKVEGCGQKFRSERYLRAHAKVHSAKKEFECPQCESRFRSRAHLGTHLESHKDLEERQVACEYCGRKILKFNMHRHVLTFHTIMGPELKCEICDLVVRDNAQLRDHTEAKHSDRVETLECSECGKKLKTKNGLQKHERTHKSAKTHACSDCGKSFLRKDTLVIHQRVHSDSRPFNCKKCDASFTQRGHLSRHEKRFH